LRKLKIYGAISWLLSFLTERERYVQIRDVDCDGTEIVINSDKLTSDMGVPQGRIIGPISFISYSNDISLRILIAVLILFADDSTVLVKGKTLQEANNNAVVTNNDFVSFAEDNLLSINASKTKVMQIDTHQTRNVVLPDLTINGTNVEAVHDYKFESMGNLGVEKQRSAAKLTSAERSQAYFFFNMVSKKVNRL
jgi:Reverse transcriptase (RNA-dependent DNA polymerase)